MQQLMLSYDEEFLLRVSLLFHSMLLQQLHVLHHLKSFDKHLQYFYMFLL